MRVKCFDRAWVNNKIYEKADNYYTARKNIMPT